MEVLHDSEKKEFVITLGDKSAVLEYRLSGDNQVDFYRTYVPFRHRGQGHAEHLVEAGLKWARQQEMEIVASCWFVRDHL